MQGRSGQRRRAPRAASAWIGLLALALACGDAPPEAVDDGRAPDVVVILIDTLRADHLPFHGYPRDTAPFLSRLAESSVVFERVHAPASATAPSTASLFTGLYPFEHGVRHGFLATRRMKRVDPTITLNRIPEPLDTLPAVLRRHGWATFGVADNLNVSAALGFDRGFDRLETLHYEGAPAVEALLHEWHDDIVGREPYFLYVHFMDPHGPYREREPWYSSYAASLAQGDRAAAEMAAYDSEINFVDRAVARLFERFGWGMDTIVVVTADHGEAFGEHGAWAHGGRLWEERIRVPLLIHHPASLAPRRVATPVSLVDVLPTLRDWLGLPPAARQSGASLLPLLRDDDAAEPGPRPLLAEIVKKKGGVVAYEERAVVRDRWKYVRHAPAAGDAPVEERLFDLEADPGETDDRMASRPDAAAALRAELAALDARGPAADASAVDVEIDESTRSHLETLGYVE